MKVYACNICCWDNRLRVRCVFYTFEILIQRSGQSKYVANGRVNSKAVGPASQKPEMLNSLLAAASPDRQKQILGEHLYPLVEKHQVNHCGNLTLFMKKCNLKTTLYVCDIFYILLHVYTA